MGVFIISPNDKGGRLYKPSEKLKRLTAPLSPIQWNARFCLRSDAVHTLSFGMTRPSHFEEMLGVLPVSSPLSAQDQAICERMDAQLDAVPHGDYEGWELFGDPSGIHVPEVLRLRRMLLGYDMRAFGQYRYNMFGTTGHWYPGRKCDEGALAEMDASRFPSGIDVKGMLRETHAALNRDAKPESGH
jgi:predicted aldo/keto reductase-like oxidoreductase